MRKRQQEKRLLGSEPGTLSIAFIMPTPITLASLTPAQRETLHTVLHVFPPGAVLVWEGKEIPLKTVKKAGCEYCR